MAITPLPTPPLRSDPTNFAARGDEFLGALPQFQVEANALAVAMNLNSTTDSSTSSITIGTGDKTFVVSSGKSFQPGMYLVLADVAAPSTNSMFGQITSYSGTSLVMSIISVRGSGTKSSWVISQSSAGGAQAGPLASSGITGAAATSDITDGTLAGSFTTLNASGAATFSAGAKITGVALLGYGTGAGGTVTQATNKLASVTLNKPCGRITMSNSALESGASVTFKLNNSLITDGNVVVVITGYFGAVNPESYSFSTMYPVVGGIIIKVTNTTAGPLYESVQLNFSIFGVATA